MVHLPILRALADSIAHVGIGALEGAGFITQQQQPLAFPAHLAETLGHVLGETILRVAGGQPTVGLLSILGSAIDHAGLYIQSSAPPAPATGPAAPAPAIGSAGPAPATSSAGPAPATSSAGPAPATSSAGPAPLEES